MLIRNPKGFGDPTLDAADDLVSELKRQYREGAVKIGISVDNVARFLLLGPAAVVTDWFKSSQQVAIEKNYADLGPQIERWATTFKSWAANGERDDGSSYDWSRWIEHARTLSGSITSQTGYSWDSSVVLGVGKALQATASDLTDPLAVLPGWVAPVAVGAGALLLYIAVKR